MMSAKKRKIVISEEEIQKRVRELGEEISRDYGEEDVILVSLLKGSFVFTADLARSLKIKNRVEFMTTSSYENQEESTGKVNIVTDLKADINGENVLIVDDILDTGNTMSEIVKHLEGKSPKTIKTCVFLDKPERRTVDIEADYVGVTIPDLFIVGYGLDYGDYYRGVPYIFSFIDSE